MLSDVGYVRIFDTTLRDGEQSPGASMTSRDKLRVAHGLTTLGVDVIEAGFPAASPDDWQAVQGIAQEVGHRRDTPAGTPPIVCGLARATPGDLEAAWTAVQAAARPRIHTFLATSEIHMRHKLGMSRAEVRERVARMVTHARTRCEDIEFSPEDAGRTDPEFLCEVLGVAIAAGATTLNIPDTVGYRTPGEYGALIAEVRAHTPGMSDEIVISVHCHDDLGLATANSLAGIEAGARQVEVTVNGIGERAGNTALEEVVMALRVREQVYGCRTGVDPSRLSEMSDLVRHTTGLPVAPNKAIVGANAFAHEAGIHQDGMLKHAETYEIMRPQSVGAGATRLVLGKHSGRHALRARLVAMGHSLSDAGLDHVFGRFKALADRKKVIDDEDLTRLVAEGPPLPAATASGPRPEASA
ncbi:MAG: 2-isopropylmalate synthase [Myxococcota bacterium]